MIITYNGIPLSDYEDAVLVHEDDFIHVDDFINVLEQYTAMSKGWC